LVQDAAYGSLLRARRQRIHADVAHALSENFVGRGESSAPVVGSAGLRRATAGVFLPIWC